MALVELADRIRSFLGGVPRDAVAPEVQARSYALAIGDLDGIYYDPAAGGLRGFGRASVNAVAAQLAFASLLNIVQSGHDVVVERLWVSSATAGYHELRIILATEGIANATAGRRDTRFAPPVVAQIREGNEAVAGGLIRGLFYVPANGHIEIAADVCLGQGSSFKVISQTVNTNLVVQFFWREFIPARAF
jgi:hypothetical protein